MWITLGVWITLLVAAAGVLVGALVYRRRHAGDDPLPADVTRLITPPPADDRGRGDGLPHYSPGWRP